MNRVKRVQFGVSAAALLVAAAHLIWPQLAIDVVTLALFVIAIVPWLAPLFRSLEFPGGVKVEFQDLQDVEHRADEAGLLASSAEVGKAPQYSFQVMTARDPNLALAGLRIEIEKRLVELAESHGVSLRRPSVGRLINALSEHELLTFEERSVLSDMVSLLNSAVHGATVDRQAVDWAMETGPRLLKTLDGRIARNGPSCSES